MTSPSGGGNAGRPDYVRDMLSRLYPTPLTLRRGVDDLAAGVQARYLVLPSLSRPRLVVPARQPGPAARAVHRQLTGRRLRTRVARVATAVVVGSGLADRATRTELLVEGPPDADSIGHWLTARLGAEGLLLTMPVGPPRATRKPVLQVCDADGRVLAFVKVGHDPLTRGLVRNEAKTLEQLHECPQLLSRTPRVIACSEWRDLTLLVLEPLLVTGMRRRGEAARHALLEAVREISLLAGTTEPAWADSLLRVSLRDQLDACGDRAAELRRQFARVEQQAPVLRMGSWHGDLNPGNLAALRDQTLVWDWERFEQGVPVGYDLLHHDLHQWITERGTRPLTAAKRLLAEAPGLLAHLDVPGPSAVVVARLYLLSLAARYLRDNQAEAGSPLGNVETWIPPALSAADPTGSRRPR